MESQNIGMRVFRRNARNIILLYNNSQIDARYRGTARAFRVDQDGTELPLITSRFVADSPEKFQSDVDGFVIAHCVNGLDPQKEYLLRVIFGQGSDTMSVDRSVLAFGAEPKPEAMPAEMHIFGYDYELKRWVPLPVDRVLYDKAKRDALDVEANHAKDWWR